MGLHTCDYSLAITLPLLIHLPRSTMLKVNAVKRFSVDFMLLEDLE